jgi:riboflavin kinase
VRCYPAAIQNIECAVILPSRSHYSDTIEVLCKYNLRRTLGLKDGDVLELRISVE